MSAYTRTNSIEEFMLSKYCRNNLKHCYNSSFKVKKLMKNKNSKEKYFLYYRKLQLLLLLGTKTTKIKMLNFR